MLRDDSVVLRSRGAHSSFASVIDLKAFSHVCMLFIFVSIHLMPSFLKIGTIVQDWKQIGQNQQLTIDRGLARTLSRSKIDDCAQDENAVEAKGIR